MDNNTLTPVDWLVFPLDKYKYSLQDTGLEV